MWMLILFSGVAGLLIGWAVLMSLLVLRIRQARRRSAPGCYFCGSSAVHMASPQLLIDDLLANWNCRPERCEVCYGRYYRIGAPQNG